MQDGFEERADIDKPEYDELMKDAEAVLASLSERLNMVTVAVSANSADVIVAIRKIFGTKYIKPDGSSEITFDMFQLLTESLRKVGEAKVDEYI